MNNVLSRVMDGKDEEPYLIWYPTIAQRSTYKHLAELKPQMRPQVVRACIVGDCQDLFDELVNHIVPDVALLAEAKQSSNLHYITTLNNRL